MISVPLIKAPRPEHNSLHFKYCKRADVNAKRAALLRTKATFLVKLGNMRHSGKLNVK